MAPMRVVRHYRRLLGLLTIAILAIGLVPRAGSACSTNTHDHHRCDEPAPACCDCGVAARPVTVQVAPLARFTLAIRVADDAAPAILTFCPEPPPPKR